MKTDYNSGNFIGKAEDSAVTILKNLTCLPEYKSAFWMPKDGIYRQIPLSFLIDKQTFSKLRADFQKGSIDIVICFNNETIAVRVQGKKGNLKLRREAFQAGLLADAGIQVVDIHIRECKELFREQVNEKSIQEVKSAFQTAKVQMPNYEVVLN